MPKRLGLRVAMLVVIIVPLNFFVFININFVAVRLLGVPDTLLANAVQIGLLVASTPLLIGVLAERYVTRPLRGFVAAIDAVQQKQFQSSIPASGIQEFDSVFAAFNDLTARLAREEELRKTLIGDTSHELNTPLAALLSQLSAMEDGVLPSTPERLAVLKQQTERLIDLVQQLDAYTQARLSRAYDAIAEICLFDVCARLQALFAPFLAEQNMRISINVTTNFTVMGDEAAVEQMLANLIRNALRYSEGTTVEIAAHGQRITVTDDGKGVALEHLPHLFERFYRVDASRNRATGGLGLGLAIVNELARRHGWHVSAENAAPGLRIVFTIPDRCLGTTVWCAQ